MLFIGIINYMQVYFCEVVKVGLKYNCVVVIVVYSYFFGEVEFSKVDCQVIMCIQQVLDLVDICLLDYLVVGGMEIILFVDCGWLQYNRRIIE